MPSWPIEMPSDTAMVTNSIGKPPASRTPSLARLARRSSGMLQGVTSFHDDATPTWGLSQSSSVMPTARSMARAGAFCIPSVTSWDRGFRGRPWRHATAGPAPGPGGHTAGVVVVLALLAGAAWTALTLGRRPRAAAGQRRRLVVGLARHPHRRRPAGRAGPPPRPWARAVAPRLPPAGPDGHRLRGPRSPGRPPTGLLAGRLDPPRGPRRPLHGGRSIPPRLELTAGG